MRRLVALVIGGSVLVAAPGFPQCHVDAVNGDDATADCSAAKPYRTLTAALKVSATDFVVAAGNYDAALGEVFPLAPADRVRTIKGAPAGGTRILVAAGQKAFLLDSLEGRGCTELYDLVIDGHVAGNRAGDVGIHTNWCTARLRLKRNRITGFSVGLLYEEALINGAIGGRDGTAQLEQNDVVDNDIGLDLRPSDGGRGATDRSRVWNNVLARNGTGIRIATDPDDRIAIAIENNTFVDGAGSAILLDTAGDIARMAPVIANNIFDGFGAVVIDDTLGTPALIDANDFYGSAAAWWVSGSNAASGNFAADPTFVDRAAGDYHLLAGSPCIDTGNDSVATVSDKEEMFRPSDGDGDSVARSDVGAFEASSVPRDLYRGVATRIDPVTPALSSFYPMGPFNPLTPVVLSAARSGDVDPDLTLVSDPLRPLALYQTPMPVVLKLVKFVYAPAPEVQVWLE